MATTTNYGWQTPDDTDLVKDGASAIRTLGSSIDTTTKNLNPETTLGDISYRSSTANTNTRLPIGTNGQVLTVSSGVPAWGAVSGGGFELIQETAASGLTSLSFSSISSSYKALIFTWAGLYVSATNGEFGLRINNSSGGYATSFMQFNGTTVVSNKNNYGALGGQSIFGKNQTTTTAENTAKGWVFIDGANSTTYTKSFQFMASWWNPTTSVMVNTMGTGYWNSTAAITSIDIYDIGSVTSTFSNTGSTSIRLWGLK